MNELNQTIQSAKEQADELVKAEIRRVCEESILLDAEEIIKIIYEHVKMECILKCLRIDEKNWKYEDENEVKDNGNNYFKKTMPKLEDYKIERASQSW